MPYLGGEEGDEATDINVPEDIEDYLSRYRIQDHAAEAFRDLPPDQQKLVMEAGPLEEARDPTALLMSRLNKAKQGKLKVLQAMAGDWKCPACGDHNFARNRSCRKCGFRRDSDPQEEPSEGSRHRGADRHYEGREMEEPSALEPQDVDAFLERSRIDTQVADRFRDLPPELQGLVMDVGSLADARDPTAVLMSRIKKAEQGTLRVAEKKPGDWSCPACGDHNFARNVFCRRCGAPNPESFLVSNRIETRAVDQFRRLPPDLQLLVMDAGSLADARDPTAVLLSRINKAEQGTLRVAQRKEGDWMCPACGDHNFAKNTSCRRCGAPHPDNYMQYGKGAPPYGKGAPPYGMAKGGKGMPMYAEYGPPGPQKRFADSEPGYGAPPAKVRRTSHSNFDAEDYLRRHGIDTRAAEIFLELPPDLQSLVMDAGPLEDARDTTAVLMSRMNKARQGTLKLLPMRPGDWKCSGCGHHNFARNDNCRRCGAPREDSPEGSYYPPESSHYPPEGSYYPPESSYYPPEGSYYPPANDPSEVDRYLEGNMIDGNASDRFRALPPHLQNLVIDAGSLADARDPTAVLMSRMKKAEQGTLKLAARKPGDWDCPACGDHNFAKNSSCRRCGAPKPDNFMDSADAGGYQPDIERYLAENHIEGRGAERFRSLPPDLQVLVMEAGSLAGARDATAVLISRMKKAEQGQLNGQNDRSRPAYGERSFGRDAAWCNMPNMPDTESFLANNGIESRVVELFRRLPPQLQCLVMDAGSLADARDPTAVLKSRIRKAEEGTLRVAAKRAGDWICTACGDHNFAKNTSCRRCGAPGPVPDSQLS
jgi:predicted RNA-binding Zn-ribbon protein involved in translation (DUF1610 family)